MCRRGKTSEHANLKVSSFLVSADFKGEENNTGAIAEIERRKPVATGSSVSVRARHILLDRLYMPEQELHNVRNMLVTEALPNARAVTQHSRNLEHMFRVNMIQKRGDMLEPWYLYRHKISKQHFTSQKDNKTGSCKFRSQLPPACIHPAQHHLDF